VSTKILLQEKPSGAFKYRQNRLAAGAPPQTLLGEFTALLRSPSPIAGGEGLAAPPQKRQPAFGPSGLSSTSGRADPHNKILRMP